VRAQAVWNAMIYTRRYIYKPIIVNTIRISAEMFRPRTGLVWLLHRAWHTHTSSHFPHLHPRPLVQLTEFSDIKYVFMFRVLNIGKKIANYTVSMY
jgi:hypothetical protein